MGKVDGVTIALVQLLVVVLAAAAEAGVSTKTRMLDFEDTPPSMWAALVPPESEAAGCSLSRDSSVIHGGSASVCLRSEQPARFGVRSRGAPFPVRGGDRCRLSAWVRLDKSFASMDGTPGVAARFTLLDSHGTDFSGGHRFVSVDGDVAETAESLSPSLLPVETWFEIAGEIVVPDGCAGVIPVVFVWKGTGAIWVDDIRLEALGSPQS